MNAYRYGFTALNGSSYPKAGLTTSKRFSTHIENNFKQHRFFTTISHILPLALTPEEK